jgi:carboxyl-terminal processing protease
MCAVRGAFSELGDPHTIFVEPMARDFERDSYRGNFGGIGAVLERREDGLVYLSPIPDNPAEVAGILEGDILLSVDGQEILAEMTIQDVVDMVRGEQGTEVMLGIIHAGETEPVEISVVRAVILLPSVSFRILEDSPDIGYFRLTRFSGESAGEVADALAFFEEGNVEKIIFDLRQNGGGLLGAAIDVSDHFLESGTIVYQDSHGEDETEFSATADTVAGDVELVILVDGGSASASEIVAGALQDHGRATLIGINTFGKGSVQTVYDLSDGSSVHVTSARWFTPDRTPLDDHGLEPDILVEITAEAQADGHDEIFEKAVEYLIGVTVK